jgi:rod shape-determining protein MreD
MKPDLLFVFSILVGYLYGTMDAVIIGLLAGFVRDAYVGRLLGLSMLICMICGIIASVFLKKILARNILLALVQVVFASIVYTVFLTIFSYVFFSVSLALPQYGLWVAKNQLLPFIVMNSATGAVLYFLLKLFGPYRIRKTNKITEETTPEEKIW